MRIAPMPRTKISGGVVHDLPADLKSALAADPAAQIGRAHV